MKFQSRLAKLALDFRLCCISCDPQRLIVVLRRSSFEEEETNNAHCESKDQCDGAAHGVRGGGVVGLERCRKPEAGSCLFECTITYLPGLIENPKS